MISVFLLYCCTLFQFIVEQRSEVSCTGKLQGWFQSDFATQSITADECFANAALLLSEPKACSLQRRKPRHSSNGSHDYSIGIREMLLSPMELNGEICIVGISAAPNRRRLNDPLWESDM